MINNKITFEDIADLIKSDVVNIAFNNIKTTVHKFTLEYAKLMFSANIVLEIYATKRYGLVIMIKTNVQKKEDEK